MDLQFTRTASQYVSGANPLQEGIPTRFSVTYEVRNPLNVPLDFTGTVEFDLGSAVSNVGATATRGTTIVTARRVTWDNFMLNPGESASITITGDLTPPPGSAGQTVVVIEGALASARTPTGAVVSARGGALTSDLLFGLANSGIVTARAPAAPGAPTITAITTGAAPAARPGVAPALPRTGTGLVADTGSTLGIWTGAAAGAFLLLAAATLIGRRRRS